MPVSHFLKSLDQKEYILSWEFAMVMANQLLPCHFMLYAIHTVKKTG